MITEDKILHFAFSIVIALFGALLTFMSPGLAAMSLVIGVAVAKELYDYFTDRGTPEIWDIVFGILGGLVALVIIEMIEWPIM